jgi:hypothetical protein
MVDGRAEPKKRVNDLSDVSNYLLQLGSNSFIVLRAAGIFAAIHVSTFEDLSQFAHGSFEIFQEIMDKLANR